MKTRLSIAAACFVLVTLVTSASAQGTRPPPNKLSQLTGDTNIVSPSTNQVPQWNGTKWVNADVPTQISSLSLATPNVIFGTPVTFSNSGGAWTGTLSMNAQSANTVFGNFTGSSATPTFTAAPTFSAANLTSFPTLNQNTTGSAASLSISGQTGLLTFSGLASTSRAKTVRDAADTILELGGSYTPTAAWTFSKSGAASTSALTLSGVPFAGTGTTSFPLLYLNDANATASTTLNTAGTYLGVNGHGTADLMNLLKDGTSQLKVSSSGVLGVNGQTTSLSNTRLTLTNDGSTGARITASTDKVLTLDGLSANAFNRLNFAYGIAVKSGAAIGFDVVNGLTLQSSDGTATWNDASTANSGTVANRYLFGIAAPTLTATGTSVTDTVASTVYIGGAPTASTNTTITTPYALNVAAGVSNFGGPLVVAASYTVATLPSTAATGKVLGAQATITDGDASLAWGATAVNSGAGATKYLCWYNGSNWTVLGK